MSGLGHILFRMLDFLPFQIEAEFRWIKARRKENRLCLRCS